MALAFDCVARTHTNTHTHTHTHTHTRARTLARTHARTHARAHARMRVCAVAILAQAFELSNMLQVHFLWRVTKPKAMKGTKKAAAPAPAMKVVN